MSGTEILVHVASPAHDKPFSLPEAGRSRSGRGRSPVGRLVTNRQAGGRGSRAVARAETGEAAAAVEIAALCSDAATGSAWEVARLADRLVALLTRLVR